MSAFLYPCKAPFFCPCRKISVLLMECRTLSLLFPTICLLPHFLQYLQSLMICLFCEDVLWPLLVPQKHGVVELSMFRYLIIWTYFLRCCFFVWPLLKDKIITTKSGQFNFQFSILFNLIMFYLTCLAISKYNFLTITDFWDPSDLWLFGQFQYKKIRITFDLVCSTFTCPDSQDSLYLAADTIICFAFHEVFRH